MFFHFLVRGALAGRAEACPNRITSMRRMASASERPGTNISASCVWQGLECSAAENFSINKSCKNSNAGGSVPAVNAIINLTA